jgi:hypothetical protein
MGLVLGAVPLLGFLGDSSLLPTAVTLGAIGLAYTMGVLSFVLGSAGQSLERREDL